MKLTVGVKLKRVLIMAVGGAGMNIAEVTQKTLSTKTKTIAVNTDYESLNRTDFEETLLLSSEIDGEKSYIKNCIDSSHMKLKDFLQDADVLVLVTGLGGRTGTEAIYRIATLAISMGITVIAAVTLPFKFEGDRREIAVDMLSKLRNLNCFSVLCHDNEADLKGSRNRSVADVFKRTSTEISTEIQETLRLVPNGFGIGQDIRGKWYTM